MPLKLHQNRDRTYFTVGMIDEDYITYIISQKGADWLFRQGVKLNGHFEYSLLLDLKAFGWAFPGSGYFPRGSSMPREQSHTLTKKQRKQANLQIKNLNEERIAIANNQKWHNSFNLMNQDYL